MELFDLLKKRRSVRKYTEKKIEKEKLEKLLQAAMLAPSGHAFYPLQFIVIEDPEMLKKMAVMRSTGSAKMLEGAAAAIVILGDTEKSDMWSEDASIAAENIYLAAEDLGLGTCWIQGRERNYDENTSTDAYLRCLLGYPENVQLECTMSIGYAAAHAPEKDPGELDYSKVHYEKY